MPRVQPIPYSLLPPQTEQFYNYAQLFNQTLSQSLPAGGLQLDDQWRRWNVPEPSFAGMSSLAGISEQQMTEELRQARYSDEELPQADSSELGGDDVEETLQEYIQRIELEALLSSDDDNYRQEEPEPAADENEYNSNLISYGSESWLPRSGLDEGFNYDGQAPSIDFSLEHESRLESEGPGPSRLRWVHREPGSQEMNNYTKYREDGNLELEMTSFWRPNRFM